jgi:NAD(P)H-hydrate epimerase
MYDFKKEEIKKLYKAPYSSSKMDNGQVTIIGGSKLFHGAPLFALTIASRIVDMVYFASPEPSIGNVAEKIKSGLFSFIWTPWEDLEKYIEKSDAVLIGPGFMRYTSEADSKRATPNPSDSEYRESREITRDLLLKFSHKKWVIDAGSLQVMEASWIPENSILTPNKKEYKMLFGDNEPGKMAKKHKCILVIKGPITYVYSPEGVIEVHGGNPGLTKGGTGDVESGLTVALLAKNEPILSASASSYIVKRAAEALAEKSDIFYNSDDLASKIPEILASLIK